MKHISTDNKPTKDGIFQYIFGREITKDLTDNFIKSLHKYINEEKILNNIKIQSEVSLEKLNIDNKISRLDILVEYDEEIFCIEMQNKYKKNIYKRARVYAAKIDATTLNIGEKYEKIKPLTMIIILNYVPKTINNSDILQNLVFVDNKYKTRNDDLGLRFIFIFLPELKKIPNNKLNCEFLQWLKFLEYEDMEVINNMSKKNNNIKRALEYVCPIPEEQQEKTLQRFHENALIEQLMDRTDARDEGIEIGKKIGKKESLLDFAKKMLIEKYNIQEIIKLTGLSENEINKLAESI